MLTNTQLALVLAIAIGAVLTIGPTVVWLAS